MKLSCGRPRNFSTEGVPVCSPWHLVPNLVTVLSTRTNAAGRAATCISGGLLVHEAQDVPL